MAVDLNLVGLRFNIAVAIFFVSSLDLIAKTGTPIFT